MNFVVLPDLHSPQHRIFGTQTEDSEFHVGNVGRVYFSQELVEIGTHILAEVFVGIPLQEKDTQHVVYDGVEEQVVDFVLFHSPLGLRPFLLLVDVNDALQVVYLSQELHPRDIDEDLQVVDEVDQVEEQFRFLSLVLLLQLVVLDGV